MASFVYPLTDVLSMVNGIQTPYKTGVLHLLKASVELSPQIDVATCEAAEADFTGYTAKTLTTLPVPYVDPSTGGVSFTIPTQQWNVGATPTVFNDIYGMYIQDAADNLLIVVLFSQPAPMQNVNNSVAIELSLQFFGADGQSIECSVNGIPT